MSSRIAALIAVLITRLGAAGLAAVLLAVAEVLTAGAHRIAAAPAAHG